jgi:hypothetical protein
MELAANPESGDLIRLSGVLRKARMKLPAPAEARARGRSTVVAEHHQSQIQSIKTKTKKTEIEFDAHTLLTRVEGLAAGKEPAVERTAKLPPPVKPIPAKEIRAIRASLGFTQA